MKFVIFIYIMHISVRSQKTVSDMVYPIEYCNRKIDCIELGINGYIDCVSNKCNCVNNSKFIDGTGSTVRGCYKEVAFGETCNNNIECKTQGALCLKAGCQHSGKICDCPFNMNFISGECKFNKHNYLRKCCQDSDCNKLDNFVCDRTELSTGKLGQCVCKDSFILYKDKCISLEELNFCTEDANCFHLGRESYCNKIKANSIGECKCPNNYILHDKKCIENMDLKICTEKNHCIHFGSEAYCERINEYSTIGYCKCPKDYIFHDNRCIFREDINLCNDNINCRYLGANAYCKTNNSLSIFGICVCNENYLLHDNKCILNLDLNICYNNETCSINSFCNKEHLKYIGFCETIIEPCSQLSPNVSNLKENSNDKKNMVRTQPSLS